MIVSKPKSTALFALGIFIIICFSMGGLALRAIINGVGAWYHYLVAFSTLILALVLLVRQVLSYKIIKVGDGLIKVTYPLRWKIKEFRLKELLHWREVIIKTKNAPFKQLELKFDRFWLKLSVQEHTNYDKILNYLRKRVGKKEET